MLTHTEDHPRLRGEKKGVKAKCEEWAGSSPLARGKVFAASTAIFAWGIIPACAGKSLRLLRDFCAFRDHPRLRGEKGGREGGPLRRLGSSPLARGKERILQNLREINRIIPACAGKREVSESVNARREDHPRLRGEKWDVFVGQYFTEGSSPLARGKVRVRPHFALSVGIIPACAGKSSGVSPCTCAGADHPRLRGEKSVLLSIHFPPHGSSPLARGKGVIYVAMSARAGIIPACAGKRDDRRGGGRIRQDHPRLRGEKALQYPAMIREPGSSPLARGKVRYVVQTYSRLRIIPACAGKSGPSSRYAGRFTDHPRLRGEK